MNSKIFAATVALGLTMASTALAQATQYSCFNAIQIYTNGPFQTDFSDATGENSVVFQESSGTDQGLLLMTAQTSCYYPFPSAPKPNVENDYAMELTIPSITNVYVTFQLSADPNTYPAFGWSPKALPGIQYSAASCQPAVDSTGQPLVNGALANMIGSVAARYEWNLSACENGRHCLPKQQFIDALNQCGDITSLQPAITAGIQSLASLPECGCP